MSSLNKMSLDWLCRYLQRKKKVLTDTKKIYLEVQIVGKSSISGKWKKIPLV